MDKGDLQKILKPMSDSLRSDAATRLI